MTDGLEIVFCMEGVTKKMFSEMPGVEKMTDKFENSGWTWVYIDLSESRGKEQIEQNREYQHNEIIIVTNSSTLAQRTKTAGICCIGYQSEDDFRFFQGVEYVLTSFEELDTTFFANAMRRFQGMTAVIAETER